MVGAHRNRHGCHPIRNCPCLRNAQGAEGVLSDLLFDGDYFNNSGILRDFFCCRLDKRQVNWRTPRYNEAIIVTNRHIRRPHRCGDRFTGASDFISPSGVPNGPPTILQNRRQSGRGRRCHLDPSPTQSGGGRLLDQTTLSRSRRLDCHAGLLGGRPPAAFAKYRHLHKTDSQVHAEALDHELSARPVLAITWASILAASRGKSGNTTSRNWTGSRTTESNSCRCSTTGTIRFGSSGATSTLPSTRPATAVSSKWHTSAASASSRTPRPVFCNGPTPTSARNGRRRVLGARSVSGTWRAVHPGVPDGGRICCRGSRRSFTNTTSTGSTSTPATSPTPPRRGCRPDRT